MKTALNNQKNSEIVSKLKSLTSDIREFGGLQIGRKITAFFDELLKNEFSSEKRSGIALIALGSYGREEMALYSDVDLLLLHNNDSKAEAEEAIEKLLYPLWDAKIDVTAATRTIEDSISAGKSDIRTLTSLLDARYVSGDFDLSQELNEAVRNHLSSKKVKTEFLSTKLDEYKKRLERYGDSVFLVEPNVKEGEGGLRCYQMSVWLGDVIYGVKNLDDLHKAGFISDEKKSSLMNSLNFICLIRNYLHLLSDRRQDRLDFSMQEEIADRLGYIQGSKLEGLETFMHDYYKSANIIHTIADRIIGIIKEDSLTKRLKKRLTYVQLEKGIYKTGDKISISGELVNSPEVISRAWLYVQSMKSRLTYETKEEISRTVESWELIPNVLRDEFKYMLQDPTYIYNVLSEMYETRYLFKLIPEFEDIYHYVQYDAYHLYTVDTHTLFVIREFSKLAKGETDTSSKLFQKVFGSVKRKDLLIWAGLLHDIGKGKEGDDGHEQKGMEIARKIMQLFGYSPEDVEKVEFLVKSHLILPHIAFHRDLNDPHLLENLENAIKTEENLQMLFLLAYSDVKATGVETWTDWKEQLLSTLYLRLKEFFEGDKTSLDFDTNLKNQLKELRKIANKEEIQGLRRMLSSMPLRYLVSISPIESLNHYRKIKRLDSESFFIDISTERSEPFTELTLVTGDLPGLFARLAYVLYSNRISILEASLFTSKEGEVIDRLILSAPGNRPIKKDFNWKSVKDAFERIYFSEKLPVENSVAIKRSAIRQHRGFVSTRIRADNDISAYFTVLEIRTEDRLGLLYIISKFLYENGFDLYMAKVTTNITEAVDTFYIKEKNSKKISSKERLSELKNGINNILS